MISNAEAGRGAERAGKGSEPWTVPRQCAWNASDVCTMETSI